MIKLETLTVDDIKYICEIVPPQVARLYFKGNPKAFAEIKPGFRPEKISDADTFSVLSKNANKPFISSFLNKMVSEWLSQIQDNCKRLVDEGHSEDEALLITIPESVFCDNCELFFKLSGQNPGEDYIRLFREAMFLTQNKPDPVTGEEESKGTDNEQIKSNITNDIIVEIKKQLEESQETETNLRKELSLVEEKLTTQKEELNTYKEKLLEEETRKNELQTELDHYRHLETFSDQEFDQEEFSQFQHVSIGQVSIDYNDQRWINRLADIIDGEIYPFYLDDSLPRYFNNRDRLFWKDGPEEVDSFGVWSWRADPNHSDPAKDYVSSQYSHYSKFTEIIVLPQCKTLSDVANELTNWFETNYVGEKIFFAYNAINGVLEGLLCSAANMERVGNMSRLLASVFLLPHYTLRFSDTLILAGKRIYKKMNLGIPQSMFRVRAPYDVIKEMLLARVTIPGLRDNDLTKKEAQKCKRFLESIPTESLIQELSDAYDCTEIEAKGYVDGFIEHIDAYLTENDFDLNIVALALERNPALIELCKNQLSDQWEVENAERIKDAKIQLNIIEGLELEKQREIDDLSKNKESLSEELQGLQAQIDQQEQLAASVEMKTSERIKKAQNNVAEFISQMAFVTSPISSNKQSEESWKQNEPSVFLSKLESTDSGSVEDIDSFEEELTENLMLVGYVEEVAVEMAQAISFSICNHLPVIIRENASLIAQCLATTIGGEQLTELFVSNQTTIINQVQNVINSKQSDYPLVYLFHGVFDGYNVNLFNELSNVNRLTGGNAVIMLSLQGIASNMILESVWNRAIYIDGDYGLEDIADKPIHAFNPLLQFKHELNRDEFKLRKKTLIPFAGVLSNIQINWYSRYLAIYNCALNDSPTILNQIIAVSRSSGLVEELKTLFHENGISNGEKLLENYL